MVHLVSQPLLCSGHLVAVEGQQTGHRGQSLPLMLMFNVSAELVTISWNFKNTSCAFYWRSLGVISCHIPDVRAFREALPLIPYKLNWETSYFIFTTQITFSKLVAASTY